MCKASSLRCIISRIFGINFIPSKIWRCLFCVHWKDILTALEFRVDCSSPIQIHSSYAAEVYNCFLNRFRSCSLDCRSEVFVFWTRITTCVTKTTLTKISSLESLTTINTTNSWRIHKRFIGIAAATEWPFVEFTCPSVCCNNTLMSVGFLEQNKKMGHSRRSLTWSCPRRMKFPFPKHQNNSQTLVVVGNP